MGIWEWMCSTTEAVKRNAPDVTPVLNATKTYCGAAFTKIDQAVRVDDVNRIRQMMPDDQTKSTIYCYSTKFAKNAGVYALHEGYKLIPGGVAVSKIVSKTINDVKNENLKLEQTSARSAAAKSPEDVIHAFMTKEFFGTRFFDDLMVSQLATKKGNKPE